MTKTLTKSELFHPKVCGELFKTLEEWLEIKALRCEEQLREVIDFVRGFGSNAGWIAPASPEHILELRLGQVETLSETPRNGLSGFLFHFFTWYIGTNLV